ncbi:MAG: U32 family peptidase [Neisseria sp.]|nr:U32 family peptidase [Neisseria sp.]
MTSQDLKLSLGPVLFFWQKETLLDFYTQMLDAPLDTVYLGEVVCSRRQQMRFTDWMGLAEDMAESGKEIVLSSHVLLESESDLKRLRKIAEQGNFKIEANDMGAVKLAREHGIPFVAGATLNIYNEATLDVFHQLGAYRWIAPAELSRDKVAAIAAQADGLETELFAWGKIPLAYSSRCFTARHYNLNKDSCEFRCLDHEHGMTMNTREGQPFLTVNGIQTMSYGCQSLLAHHQDLAAIGVNLLRLSPQLTDMPRIIALHRAVLDGQADGADALAELKQLSTGTLVDGYWHGQPGIETLKEEYYGAA